METKSRKNCMVCGNEIYRSNRRGQLKGRRSKRSLTCSKSCSKIYGRMSKYIYNTYYQSKIGKLKKRIKELENV